MHRHSGTFLLPATQRYGEWGKGENENTPKSPCLHFSLMNEQATCVLVSICVHENYNIFPRNFPALLLATSGLLQQPRITSISYHPFAQEYPFPV